MAVDPALLAKAEQIRDANTVGENTAVRVGSLFVDIVNALGNVDDTFTTLSTYLTQYMAKLGADGILDWQDSPIVLLASMGATLDGDAGAVVNAGDLYFYDHGGYQIFVSDGHGGGTGYPATQNVLYVNTYTGKMYEWDGADMVEIVGASGDVVNNCDTNDGTKALSAKQGKIIKANIEQLHSDLADLVAALANIAFTSLPKPVIANMDWAGDKYRITLNNTLSGCTADKSGVQQVNEGSTLTVTITASAGNMLRSVTASSGTVTIAANQESATITIANVMADATVNITASATTKGSFSASINDSRVSGTGATSGITEGSSWTSVFSLNNTAEEGASLTAISASMAGGGSISVVGNTVSTSFVTGNITITATVVVAGRYDIVLPAVTGVSYVDSNDDPISGTQHVPDTGLASFECFLKPDLFYNITTVAVTMGGNDITSTAYNSATKRIYISAVTDDVNVSVAVANTNKVYQNIRYTVSSNEKYLLWGDEDCGVMSPLIDLGAGRTTNRSLKFTCRQSGNDTSAGMLYFDENGNVGSFYTLNSNPRTLSVPATVRYVRIVFLMRNLQYAYIQDTSTSEYLFNGSTYDTNDIGGWEDFFEAGYETLTTDAQGDYPNMATSQITDDTKTVISGPTFIKQTPPWGFVTGLNTTIPRGISRVIQLPLHGKTGTETRPFTFSCGAVSPSLQAPVLILIKEDGTESSSAANANPRTVNISAEYVACRMMWLDENYANAYLRDDTDNTMLWEPIPPDNG